MDILLKNSSEVPIYRQIYEQIKGQILNKKLKAGTTLPPIRALAKSLKVSVITVKRAYQELGNDGYIETAVGRGTFVCEVDESLRKKEIEEFKVKIHALMSEAKASGISFEDVIEIIKDSYELDIG